MAKIMLKGKNLSTKVRYVTLQINPLNGLKLYQRLHSQKPSVDQPYTDRPAHYKISLVGQLI